MKNTFIFLGIFGAGFLIGGFTLWTNIKFIGGVSPKNHSDVKICEDALNRFSSLYQATSEIGQIPYDASFSDCYDHSKLLTQKLAERNIRSSIMVNKDRSHAWVAVWIEATSGQFVPIKDGEQKLLEIRDGTNITNVQCYNSYESNQ